MANHIADFMGRKPSIRSYREIMEPEFSLFLAAAYMNMRWLVAFVRVEERAIGTPAKNRWHVFPLTRPRSASPPLGTLSRQGRGESNAAPLGYTGRLLCFRPGISTVLPRRSASAGDAGARGVGHDHVDVAALGGTLPDRLESGILPPTA
jgi:hypothetical protein